MLRVVTVYPDLLGTYGDRGNGLVLERRAALRGIDVELVEVPSDATVPRADLYCIGGGEDGPQQLAVERLERDGTLQRAVDDGAVVLAVCAGLQVLGRSFPGADGARADGLGLLGVDTVGQGDRERWARCSSRPQDRRAASRASRTTQDEPCATRASGPSGAWSSGVGNGDGTDGARRRADRGTYLHGPVLARNPALADLLLALALGEGRARAARARARRGAARRAARRGAPRSLRGLSRSRRRRRRAGRLRRRGRGA